MPKNSIEFLLTGRYALFTDPITRIGGEKTSYHLPTYEALKGVCKSIYWKPSIIWYIDKVRVINPIRTQTKGMKPMLYSPTKKKLNDLTYYTYLHDVAYQVQAHFEWNMHRPELEADRIDGKHYSIAKRMVDKGGRQDIFLGTRECQGYVEPCVFGSGEGAYDDIDELSYGTMFHSYAYPDETGIDKLHARLWQPTMRYGVIEFIQPSDDLAEDNNNGLPNRFIREMTAKAFELDDNMLSVSKTQETL